MPVCLEVCSANTVSFGNAANAGSPSDALSKMGEVNELAITLSNSKIIKSGLLPAAENQRQGI